MELSSKVAARQGPGQVGRPRDAVLDAAIEAAAVELLAERGYNGLSIKSVAERAGTTTPTVYRRWSSKAELVLSAAFRTEGEDVVSDTEDLDSDVRTMIRWTLEKLGHPGGQAALAGLLGEPAGSKPDLKERLSGVWRRLGERLQKAVDTGEIRDDLDLDTCVAGLVGPPMFAAVLRGEEAVTRDRVEALASIVLDGIRSRPSENRGKRTGRRR